MPADGSYCPQLVATLFWQWLHGYGSILGPLHLNASKWSSHQSSAVFYNCVLPLLQEVKDNCWLVSCNVQVKVYFSDE